MQKKNQKNQKKKNQLSRRPIQRGAMRSLPAAYTGPPRLDGIPKFSQSGRDVVISHCETFYDQLSVTQSFANSNPFGWPVQPARNELFPWLWEIAAKYETYRFQKLEFCYWPRVGTQSRGYASAYFDFDSRDPPASSEQRVLAQELSDEQAVYTPFRISVPKSELNKLGKNGQLYTRVNDSQTTGGDLKTYDVGRFWIFGGGHEGAGVNLGRWDVCYSIVLSSPQDSAASSIKARSARITGQGTTKASPFGSSPLYEGGMDVDPVHHGLSGGDPRGSYFWLPQGTFMLDSLGTGTGVSSSGGLTISGVDAFNSPPYPHVVSTNDITSADNVYEAVTYLINNPNARGAIFAIAAAGFTTLSGLVLRCAYYGSSSSQTVGLTIDANHADPLNETPLDHED